MGKYIYGFFVVLLISGCGAAAKVEAYPNSKAQTKFAPINPNNQYGIISYKVNRFASESRKIAYHEMYKICNTKYQIVSEDEKQTGAFVHSNGVVQVLKRNYITFECIK